MGINKSARSFSRSDTGVKTKGNSPLFSTGLPYGSFSLEEDGYSALAGAIREKKEGIRENYDRDNGNVFISFDIRYRIVFGSIRIILSGSDDFRLDWQDLKSMDESGRDSAIELDKNEFNRFYLP